MASVSNSAIERGGTSVEVSGGGQPVSTVLLFGATGDLARRMLLPSLYGLDADGLLPESLKIVATARSPLSDAEYRAIAADSLREHLAPGLFDEAQAKRLLSRLHYVPLDATHGEEFGKLKQAIGAEDGGVAIFLSTAPSLFKATIEGLRQAGLTGPDVRMALEKPLGSDLESSRAINDAVASAFPEGRIYRVDHYLGKETVQNLIALRFANAMFEPLWNRAHIDHVQITVAEEIGLEGRGDYYDGAGAIRDMVQNHMLQLLALVAMEPPAAIDPTSVRDEKVKVLQSLRPIAGDHVREHSVIGQYDGYQQELGRTSATETFVALKAEVANWRWSGVPFYLRTGKRMKRRKSEIFIQFKCVPHSIFAAQGAQTEPNKLVIGLQPEETIRLLLMAKQPGLDRHGIRLREIPLDLSLANAFSDYRRRIAYERLLLDLIEGDPTLFVRRDEVEAQWAWIDAIRRGWREAGMAPQPYAEGSWGPARADSLVRPHGIAWHD